MDRINLLTLKTGYIFYIHESYDYFKSNVIEHFPIHDVRFNSLPIYQIVQHHEYYSDFVVRSNPDLLYYAVGVTEENIKNTLDWLKDTILTIESEHYPLNRFEVAVNFLKTQEFDECDTPEIDAMTNFLMERLREKRYYFS